MVSPVSLALLACFSFVLYRSILKPLRSPLRRLPSPVQEPVYRRLFVEPSPEQLEVWAKSIPNEGLIRYYGILNKERVLVTDIGGLHGMLTLQPYSFRKPLVITKIIRALLGDGLVVVEGEAHKAQKRKLQPAFKLGRIKDLYPSFRRKGDQLVGVLVRDTKAKECETKSLQRHPVNIATYINRVALDTIGIAGFGLDFNCLLEPGNRLATDYTQGFAPSKDARFHRMLAIFVPEPILDRLPLRRAREIRTAVAAVKECAGDVIRARKASAEKTDSLVAQDIIGVLMDDGNITDVDALIDQCMTLLGAGHDTVVAAVMLGMYELSRHPSIQERLREEVRRVLPWSMGKFEEEAADIDSLPFLAAVCNEIFRLHPSIPFLHRENIEPVELCNQSIPKGTALLTSIRLMNRSSELWGADPTTFNPERWLQDPYGGAKERYAFMTFGQGARHCIGERFARAEVKYLLAILCSSFRTTFVGTGENGRSEEMQLEHGITSRVVGGLWVDMELLED